jgi:large subunit ribosomal protein L6
MSRIGNKPVPIPANTKVTIDGRTVKAEGPHGTLSVEVNDSVTLAVDKGQLMVANATGRKEDKKFHGLYRSLLNNIIIGVSEGFTRKLEMVGVGYKATVAGKEIVLDVGFSNSKRLKIPTGIKVSVEKNIAITLWGNNKEVLGQFAADIRKIRPPEPYKGKGIRYEGEVVRRKAGKAGAIGKGG